MATFPENEVKILRDYVSAASVASSLQALNQAIPAIKGEIVEVAGFPDVFETITARESLKSFLSQPQINAALTSLQTIADAFEKREFGNVLATVTSFPSRELFLSQQTLSRAFNRNAQRYDEIVEKLGGGGVDKPGGNVTLRFHRVLAGYKGPALGQGLLDLNELINPKGEERRFRLGLLRAESFFGQHDFRDAITEYNKLLSNPTGMSVDERKFIALRNGFAHLARADQMYRSFRQLSQAECDQVLAEYAAAIQVVQNAGIAIENPLYQQIIDYAELQKAKLAAGFNFLGFKDSYVPIWRPELLLEKAQQRIRAAKDAVNQFVNFRSQANQLDREKAELMLQQQVDKINSLIADEKLLISDKQLELANQRIDALHSQIDSLLENAVISASIGLIGSLAAAEFGGGKGSGSPIDGLTSAVTGYLARQQELENQLQVAQADQVMAGREQHIAALEKQIVDARVSFVQDRLATVTSQVLSADLFYALANLFEILAEKHTDAGIRWAYLYERAVAFRRLKPHLQIIKLDYRFDFEGQGVLIPAPDLLENDLVLVNEQDLPDTETQPLRENPISLRTAYPLEFSRFQQMGQMSFVISLYDLEKKRPGVFARRIRDVHLQVIGLIPPTGFSGRIIHHGFFLLRDKDSTLAADRFTPTKAEFEAAFADLQSGHTQGDVIKGVIPYLLDEDRRELSAAQDGNMQGPDEPGALGLFEGYGETGKWTLEIDNVDPKLISDILLTFDIFFPESDAALQQKVTDLIAKYETELVPGDQIDKITSFSLHDDFPEALSQLSSGQASFELHDSNFPSDLTDLRVKTIVAQALDRDGAGLTGLELEFSRPETPFTLTRTTGPDGFSEPADQPVPFIAAQDRVLAQGPWQIHLTDTSLLDVLDDLRLFFVHEFRQL